MVHLPRSSYQQKPWKNGLGVTEEILIHPAGSEDFLFRVSMAALTTSGPFSHFPEIDRTLLLLEGSPVKLNDRVVPLLTPVEFPGEEKIFATIDTEGRDLNLMCRRGRASGNMEVCSSEMVWTGDAEYCVIFSLTDSTFVGQEQLKKYDACLLTREDHGTVIRGDHSIKISIDTL